MRLQFPIFKGSTLPRKIENNDLLLFAYNFFSESTVKTSTFHIFSVNAGLQSSILTCSLLVPPLWQTRSSHQADLQQPIWTPVHVQTASLLIFLTVNSVEKQQTRALYLNPCHQYGETWEKLLTQSWLLSSGK